MESFRPLLCQFCGFVIVDRNSIWTGFRLRFAVPVLLSQICSNRSDSRVLLILVSSIDHSLSLSISSLNCSSRILLPMSLMSVSMLSDFTTLPKEAMISNHLRFLFVRCRQTRWSTRYPHKVMPWWLWKYRMRKSWRNNLLGPLLSFGSTRASLDAIASIGASHFIRCFGLLWSRSEQHRIGWHGGSIRQDLQRVASRFDPADRIVHSSLRWRSSG